MVTWGWNTEISEGLISINCWENLCILGKIGLSILATKCCHLVLWGQDLLHIQSACRLNKVDENLPYRIPYKCIFFLSDMALLLLKLFKNSRFAQEVFPLQQHKQWGGRENSSWESLLTILPSVWPPVLLRPLPTGHMWTKTALRPPQGTGKLQIKSQTWYCREKT